LDQEDEKVWGNDASERRQHLLHAYQLASDFGFLTPVTDMYLKSQISDDEYQEPSEVDNHCYNFLNVLHEIPTWNHHIFRLH
jgi:hypothetical protein